MGVGDLIAGVISGIMDWFVNWWRDKRAAEDRSKAAALEGREESIEAAGNLEDKIKDGQAEIAKSDDAKTEAELLEALRESGK